MRPAKTAGTNRIVRRDGVVRVIVAIDHQLAGLREQGMAIARQVSQLERLAEGVILGRHVLDGLQGRLVHDAGSGEVDDEGVGVYIRRGGVWFGSADHGSLCIAKRPTRMASFAARETFLFGAD